MAKATITSVIGEGQYAVRIEYDTDYLDDVIASLAQQLIDIEQPILDAQVELIDLRAARVAAANALDDAIEEYTTALETNPTAADASPVTAATKTLAAAATAVDVQRLKVQKLTSQKLAIAARKTLLENNSGAQQPDAGSLVWCADYTTDISNGATVPIALIPGEVSGATWTILPQQHPDGYGATYDRESFGQLVPRMSMTPEATFYNWAMLPGWQRWMPTFRHATIESLDTDNDTCSIALETARSSANPWPYSAGLNVNLAESTTTRLTDVPVKYMTCNASAFEVGDRVLVRFKGVTSANAGVSNWDQPEVIGFVSAPRQCFGIGFHFLYNEPGGSAPMLIRGEFGGAWRKSANVSTNRFFSPAISASQRYPLYTWHGDEPWKWTGIVGKGARQCFQDPDVLWPRVFRVYTILGPVIVSGLSSFSEDRISAAWFQEVGGVDKLRIVVTRGSINERIYEIDAETVLSDNYGLRSVSLSDFEQVAEIDISRFLPIDPSGEIFMQPWAVNRSATEMITLRTIDHDIDDVAFPQNSRFPTAISVDLSAIPSGGVSNVTGAELEPTTTESSFVGTFTGTLNLDSCTESGGLFTSTLSGTYNIDYTSTMVVLVGVDYEYGTDTAIYYKWRTVTENTDSRSGSGYKIISSEGCASETGSVYNGEIFNTGSSGTAVINKTVRGYLDFQSESLLLYQFDEIRSDDTVAEAHAASRDYTFTFTSLIGLDTRRPDIRPYKIETVAVFSSSGSSTEEPVASTGELPQSVTYTTVFYVDDVAQKTWGGAYSRTISFGNLAIYSSFYNYTNSANALFSYNFWLESASQIPLPRYEGIPIAGYGPNITYTPTTIPINYGATGLSAWPLIWSSPLMYESPYEKMKGHIAVLPSGDYIANMPDIELDYDNGDPSSDVLAALTSDTYNSSFWRDHITWQSNTLFRSNVLTEDEINTLTERTEPERWRVYDIVTR